MQLYALEGIIPLPASRADKGKNYRCPECNSIVRVRSGPSRQIHFYHLRTSKNCRQNQKSEEHLQLQLKLFHLIGQDVALEFPFPSISRIADVVWHAKKIVFEVQCSPISLEEVQSRNLDYQNEGYTVIWILHDKRFNQSRLSAAESFLRESLSYFTNINKAGEGIIYDQFEVLKSSSRLFKGPQLPIDPLKIYPIPSVAMPDHILPKILLRRLSHWKSFAAGDLLHRLLKEGNLSVSSKKMVDLESKFTREKQIKRLPLRTLLAKSYLAVLDGLLNKP